MTKLTPTILCFHCGSECPDETIKIEEKHFCCNGCKTVYQILEENNLCQYYDLEKMAGNAPQIGAFAYLSNLQWYFIPLRGILIQFLEVFIKVLSI